MITHSSYGPDIYIYIWVNCNNSRTWIKAIWGWFSLLTMIPVRSRWGRYNLPRYIYIYLFIQGCVRRHKAYVSSLWQKPWGTTPQNIIHMSSAGTLHPVYPDHWSIGVGSPCCKGWSPWCPVSFPLNLHESKHINHHKLDRLCYIGFSKIVIQWICFPSN